MLTKAERDFLAGELRPRPRPGYERKLRQRIRGKTISMLDELTLTLGQLERVSKRPGKDYARIFQDEGRYFKLLGAANRAYEVAMESNLGLFNPKHLPIIQDAVSKAGMGYYSKTELKDARLRQKLLDQLKQKEDEDGEPYYKDVCDQILTKRPDQVIEAEANCEIERSRRLLAWWRKEHARGAPQA